MTRDNAADTIRAARAEVGENAAVSAPIYPGDAMRLRQDSGTLTASQYVELGTDEALSNHTGEVIFRIPKQLARREADIDRLISEMVAPINEGKDPELVADNYQMRAHCCRSMKAVVAPMKEIHAADRNHVWVYYIRNMIRPAVMAEAKVDRVIGNPPCLTYGQSPDIIRDEVRGMSESRYQIWGGGKLSTHPDITNEDP